MADLVSEKVEFIRLLQEACNKLGQVDDIVQSINKMWNERVYSNTTTGITDGIAANRGLSAAQVASMITLLLNFEAFTTNDVSQVLSKGVYRNTISVGRSEMPGTN